MPAYNKESYISEAINSFICQDYKDKELIIIDDHSTDGTADIAKHYISDNVKYYRNDKNMGVAYCRNLARKKASGDIMCVLDADDIAYNHRSNEVANFFKKNKDKDIFYGSAHICNILSKVQGTKEAKDFAFVRVRDENYLTHSTVSFRKNVPEYRDVKFIDDWYFYLDSYLAGHKFGYTDSILGVYRLDPSGITYSDGMKNDKKERAKELLKQEFAKYEEDLTEAVKKSYPQQVRFKEILKRIPKGSRVLDIGCNGGYLMQMIMKKGCKVEGVEKAPNLIKICQKKGLTVYPQLGYWANKFDVVVLGDILEHFTREAVLKACTGIIGSLTSTGKLIITVPYKHGKYSTKYLAEHINDYDAKDFKEMLPENQVDSYPICVGNDAIPYWTLLEVYK
jgi:glycosyltransferase involved in cell wall biosynthesis